MYISHYIQVLNFAIIRGELKPAIQNFYSLENYGYTLPPLSTEQDLLKWGKQIIDGDRKRIMNGGVPIYNPSIAVVRVHFENFSEAYYFQKNLQSTTERFSISLNELRKEADNLILCLWNEIETSYEPYPEAVKREKAEEYGILYVYRKSEVRKREAVIQ
jgi:hypothetical protein